MNAVRADKLDIETARQLSEVHLDITGAVVVDVSHNEDRSVLWVNVNGVCALRICQIAPKGLILPGEQE